MKADHQILQSSAVLPAVKGFSLIPAETPGQISQARELFLEYAQSLGFSLCFQNFEQELANLPGHYAPPSGRLLLAEYESQLAGCVALHRLELSQLELPQLELSQPDEGVCEMKRLYLRPQFRGKGLGRALADRIIAEAREIGYSSIRLDTVEPAMREAVAMYRKLGFREIAPYCKNPIAGALYMELQLNRSALR
jgi:putative acetyltransferase